MLLFQWMNESEMSIVKGTWSSSNGKGKSKKDPNDPVIRSVLQIQVQATEHSENARKSTLLSPFCIKYFLLLKIIEKSVNHSTYSMVFIRLKII